MVTESTYLIGFFDYFCFNKKLLKDPLRPILLLSSLLIYTSFNFTLLIKVESDK